MQKSYWVVLFIMIFLVAAAQAITLDDIILNATSSNLTINITSAINLSAITVGTDYVYFSKVNYSNPSQANVVESLSYNITDTNKAYTQTDLPYIASSNLWVKRIGSNIAGSVSGSMDVDVDSCYLSFLQFDTLGTAYDKTYNSTEWSCSSNRLSLNFTGMQQGASYLRLGTSTVASNCTTGNVTLTFNIKDEDNPADYLAADAAVELNYWMPDGEFYVQNFTLDYSGSNNYSVCLTNNVTELQADLYIIYNATGGFTHRYILVNHTLSVAAPEEIDIYNFATQTGISDLRITVRENADYQYYPNVIGKLQRRYTGEGVWRTVQMDKSGDFGLQFYNIREETTDYRLIFTDMYNNVLKTTNTIKFSCTSSLCELTVLLDPYSATAASDQIVTQLTYNNNTQILSLAWEDLAAGSNTVQLLAGQSTLTGHLWICNETDTAAASGTMSCDLSGRTGVIEVTVTANDEITIKQYIDIITGKLGNFIGTTEGAFWAVMIMITCLMFGIFSPVGAIITMFIGLVTVYLLGIFTPITITFVVISAVLGILIGFKVRN